MSVADEIYAALAAQQPEPSFFTRFGNAVGQMPLPVARSNAEALLGPLAVGLASGIASGYGKAQDRENLFDYYREDPLIKALAGASARGSEIGPVVSGEDYASLLAGSAYTPYQVENAPVTWTPEIGKRDLLSALLGQQQAQEELQSNAKLAAEMQKQQADLVKTVAGKHGVIFDPITGTSTPIPGIEIEGKGKKDWLESLGAQELSQVRQAFAMINSLDDIANKLSSVKDSAATWKVNSSIPGTAAFQISRDLRTLVTPIVRSLGEVGALTEKEQARALSIIEGNLISGPETVKNLVTSLKSRIGQMSSDRLYAAKIGAEAGGDELLKRFEAAAKAAPKRNIIKAPDGNVYEIID